MNTSAVTTTTMLPTEAAQEIYELAISHREETEQLRRLAPAVVDRIKASGLFRMGLPKFLGGWEDNPVEVLKAYEILSSGEAAVAWSVWNNHLACTFGRFLDEDSMREIYKNHSDVYANSARPEGIAEIVDGGYSVSGRWSLVSGCELSDWFVMRCLVTSDDLPKTLGPGAKLKLFFIPKEDINIIDTWSVGGLRGTGSHDIEIKDAFVQEKYAIDFENTVHVDNAYNRLPIGCLNSAGCASIALGLLKSATDELINLCLERVTPGKSPDLRDRESIQSTIAKSKTTLASKRTQLHNAVENLWNESLEGNTYTDIQLADVWAASIEAATASRALVSEIYAVTGTASLYTKYKIERVHRDVHAVLQHGMVQPHWLNQAGMAYVGLKPNGAMFRT
ncbi:acyl-CoA dehydrogenase family protein [Winogradskyella forsetii]|uniref:acyl-CoA dehydrogenase family protein n=1 Tax=Winogradskyella forsetii TaxID=2686077 RepID=UPI0015BCB2CB|nr:acyl-CoA dehydrogenase family protein [Winogradskyella forsetii]